MNITHAPRKDQPHRHEAVCGTCGMVGVARNRRIAERAAKHHEERCYQQPANS